MKHLTSILLILTLTLTACTSTRKMSGGGSGNPGSGKPAEANRQEAKASAKTTAYVSRVAGQTLRKNWVTASAKVGITGFGQDLTVSGQLKMKRDDVIRLSLRFLGMEVGLMEFTPTDVLLVDRAHKQYVRAPYSEVGFLTDARLDFYALQALFWNELFVPGSRQPAHEAGRFKAVEADGYSVIMLDDTPRLDYLFYTRADRALIERVSVKERRGTGKTEFNWTYGNFRTFGGRPFPTEMLMRVTGAGKNLALSLRLSSLGDDSGWNTRTTVSSKYTRRTVDEVLRGLKF